MKNNPALENILNAREARDAFEQKLLSENPNDCLITLRANYPGENKNTMQSHAISYFCFLELQKNIKAKKIFHRLTAEGLVFFIVTNEDAVDVKRKSIKIEEDFFLGRLIDIDVRNDEKIFSRKDLNVSERKCLLCEKRAVLCVRNRSHSVQDLLEKISETVSRIFTATKSKTALLANIARVSMLEELCRTYSFGCVTVNHTGSHCDMDFLLMLRGIDLVAESLAALKKENTKNFYTARQHGIPFEKKLIKACGGVNTYKGAHFLLLILCSAVLNCKSFYDLESYIADFSRPCLADLALDKQAQKIEKLGIRDEAISGFKKHFNLYLPLIEAGSSNTALSLKIIANTFDTTSIKRAGLDALLHIQELARTADSEDKIKALDDYCRTKKISTGGVADNFILSYALYLIKKYYYN